MNVKSLSIDRSVSLNDAAKQLREYFIHLFNQSFANNNDKT